MAFSSAKPAGLERSWSIGPAKIQVKTLAAENGDTSGTLVADALASVDVAIITGLSNVAQTITGNSVAITFTDPAADAAGQVIFIGK